MIEKIYDKLVDDESRFLFGKKIESLVMRDGRIFLNAINELDREWKVLEIEQIHREPNRPIIIWGAGINGISTLRLLEKSGCAERVIGFVDSNWNKMDSTICGKRVLAPSDLIRHTDALVIISAYWKTAVHIFEQVMKMYEVPKENIIFPRQGHLVATTGQQYFDYFQPTANEVFIDAGASYGNTSGEFAEWTNNNYEGIVAFEPRIGGEEFYNKSVEKYNLKNARFVNKGTWSSTTKLHFVENGSASKITLDSENIIDVTSIDEVLNGEKATFIKMDVEGSELESLIGAQNTIKKYRPRMALSLYHKPTDFFEIPSYILQLDDTYRFAIRQYHFDGSETVLYAF